MPGWWSGSREDFLSAVPDEISDQLSGEANRDGWEIEREQMTEWRETVGLLQNQVFRNRGVEILREALASDKLGCIHGVVLEFDFKRRGIRIDAILLAGKNVLVVEFKRSKLTSGDHDQVVNYCINLVEFHDETQNMIGRGGYVVPILVSREDSDLETQLSDLEKCYDQPWEKIPNQVTKCHGSILRKALEEVVRNLPFDGYQVPIGSWDNALFKPSSNIVDAALSLYGNHDVSAILEHNTQMETIQRCTDEIRSIIRSSRANGGRSLVFMSGSPGAGKTLVGLDLTFSQELKDEAVFMTGNAPLVEVLQESLKKSYKKMSESRVRRLTGYTKDASRYVTKNTVFKIVKAHHFLKPRGKMNQYQIDSTDGDILVIDEAQRTYQKDRIVIGEKLPDHEANMIIEVMQGQRRISPVIVLLIGHNQNINRGERGAGAWLEAAEKYDWDVYISDQTLSLSEFTDESREFWTNHPQRKNLDYGHLNDSIRHYRNTGLERWAHHVLTSDHRSAIVEANKLNENKDTIWITRSLKKAKSWIKTHRVGEQRAGMIASGKGGRLPAEGLFPSMKPNIAKWMLEPSGDIRSSNMLETVQNQFQIQGLELDYTIVCWDADLRRENEHWVCYDLSGSRWNKMTKETDGKNTALQERKNGYRVLLTRARKGMVIFVPKGDTDFQDQTRRPEFYDEIYEYLTSCGAKELSE